MKSCVIYSVSIKINHISARLEALVRATIFSCTCEHTYQFRPWMVRVLILFEAALWPNHGFNGLHQRSACDQSITLMHGRDRIAGNCSK